MSSVNLTLSQQDMVAACGAEGGHILASQYPELTAARSDVSCSSLSDDAATAKVGVPMDHVVSASTGVEAMNFHTSMGHRSSKSGPSSYAPMVTQSDSGSRKVSDSSGSDTTPMNHFHGLLLQQTRPEPTVVDTANQASQQSWLQLQALLVSNLPQSPSVHPPGHTSLSPSPQMLSPRVAPHIIPSATAPSHIGSAAIQTRTTSHLRDGEPATPDEVVSAILEYMARPNKPKPPCGCAPDAIKLFVGNIPKHCTEAVLHKVFQMYGHIVEIAVTRNRHSAESKGSAFVWYATLNEAARSILSLHSRYTFPDAKGEHVRLVTVRPAVKTLKPQVQMFPYDMRKASGLAYPGIQVPGAEDLGAYLNSSTLPQPYSNTPLHLGIPSGLPRVPQSARGAVPLPSRPPRLSPRGSLGSRNVPIELVGSMMGGFAQPQPDTVSQLQALSAGLQSAQLQGLHDAQAAQASLYGQGGHMYRGSSAGPHPVAPPNPSASTSAEQAYLIQAMTNMQLALNGQGLQDSSASILENGMRRHSYQGPPSNARLSNPEYAYTDLSAKRWQ